MSGAVNGRQSGATKVSPEQRVRLRAWCLGFVVLKEMGRGTTDDDHILLAVVERFVPLASIEERLDQLEVRGSGALLDRLTNPTGEAQ